MRAITLIFLMFCMPCLTIADPPGEDWAVDAKMMTGQYIIVGKKPDSNSTYYGHLSFGGRGKKLAFVRTVNHVTVRGMALLDIAKLPVHIPVLRMRFIENGQVYYGVYQWIGDSDNYIRFMGYVYPRGRESKSAGLETFFPVPPLIRD